MGQVFLHCRIPALTRVNPPFRALPRFALELEGAGRKVRDPTIVRLPNRATRP